MTSQFFVTFLSLRPHFYRQTASVLLLWKHRVLRRIKTVTAGNLTAGKRSSLDFKTESFSQSVFTSSHFTLNYTVTSLPSFIYSTLCHILSLTNKRFFFHTVLLFKKLLQQGIATIFLNGFCLVTPFWFLNSRSASFQCQALSLPLCSGVKWA